MSIRVIVGSSNEKLSMQIVRFLTENGYLVIGETRDGFDLLRRASSSYPDLVIVDYNLKGASGHEVSEILIGDHICPVIAMISQTEIHYFVNLSQEPTFAPIVKPCGKQLLMQTIQLLVKASKSLNRLETQLKTVRNDQELKKTVDLAKKLLMENMGLTEDEAHRRIQKQSMDTGVARLKVAEDIIRTYQ